MGAWGEKGPRTRTRTRKGGADQLACEIDNAAARGRKEARGMEIFGIIEH